MKKRIMLGKIITEKLRTLNACYDKETTYMVNAALRTYKGKLSAYIPPASGGTTMYVDSELTNDEIRDAINIYCDKNMPNMDEFFANLTTVAKRPGSLQAHPVVASSVCKILMGILFDTKELGHAPGPNGLPGGYPVKLSADGVDVFLPEGLTREEAIEINEKAQVFEGVESIEPDGTVVLTDKSAGIFKKLLDIECKAYTVENAESKAKELDEKFKKWAAQYVS